MKSIVSVLLTGVIFLQACKKDTDNTYAGLSGLTVANAALGVSSAKVYAADHLIPWKTLPASDAVAFGKSGIFGAFAGDNFVEAVSAADTTVTLFNNGSKREPFRTGGLYTLFLTGETGSYEGVFLADETIPSYTDEVVGIRVINLSPNSSQVHITLASSPTVNEQSNLSYKQISGFKTYASDATVSSITFQVRNATDNSLLASYTLSRSATTAFTSSSRPVSLAHGTFKNITLVIKGLQGTTSGSNAFSVFPVPHY